MKKKQFKVKISSIITFVFILLFLYFLKDINIFKVYRIVIETNLFYFGLAFLSIFFSFFILAVKLKVNMSEVCYMGFWSSFVFLCGSLFFNLITPGRSLGGDFILAYFLKKKYKKTKSKFLGAILADKLSYYTSLFLLTFLSLIFVLFFFHLPRLFRILLELILILLLNFLIIIFLIVIFRKRINFVKVFEFIYSYFLKFLIRLRKNKKGYLRFKLKEIEDSFFSLVHNKIFYLSVLLSLVSWAFLFTCSYSLFLSLGIKINFLYIVVILVIGCFFGEVSITPGGIGLFEGMMFLLYSFIGVPRETALVVVILNSFLTYFFSLFLGFIFAFYLKLKYSS